MTTLAQHAPPPESPAQRPRSVVVVGGGCAGIAAAVRLAGRGVPVTLVETRKRLGGRATSFPDPETGELLDNCQHVLMSGCTNLMDLYKRLGVSKKIQWSAKLYFKAADGSLDTLVADDLPAPMHMLRPMLKFRGMGLRDKLAIMRGMVAVMQVSYAGRRLLEDQSFADFLERNGQPASAIDRFWNVVCMSALNGRVDEVAASYAVMVFQEGFMYNTAAQEMGVSNVPLAELYDPAEAAIEHAGGKVLLSTSAQAFEFEGDRLAFVRTTDGQEIFADAFISALPHDRLAKLSGPAMAERDERLRRLDEFTTNPILGIHMKFRAPHGGPVMQLPHFILTDSPLQWIFNKGFDLSEQNFGAHHLHGVISAASDWVDKPAEEILAMAEAEARKHLTPDIDGATLEWGKVIKEKRATFVPRPRRRPDPSRTRRRHLQPLPRRRLDPDALARHDGGRGPQRLPGRPRRDRLHRRRRSPHGRRRRAARTALQGPLGLSRATAAPRRGVGVFPFFPNPSEPRRLGRVTIGVNASPGARP